MLHRTSIDSQGARIRKKLLAKTTWFKKKKMGDEQVIHGSKSKRGEPGSKWGNVKSTRELDVKSVLFVEQSPGGELAKRMRDILRNMEPTMGFRVKVAERTGRSLGSQFSLTKL